MIITYFYDIFNLIKIMKEGKYFMRWYRNMNEKQKNDFNKVIAVVIIGIILISVIPIIIKVV